MSLWHELWTDQRGGVNSAELMLIATVIVIGALPGLGAVREALVNELADLAAAIGGTTGTTGAISISGSD